MHSLQLQVSRVMVSYNAISQIYRVEHFNFQLHNAAKNKFLTLYLYVNSCSPEGAAKMSTFTAL